jgi:hypothetical protein
MRRASTGGQSQGLFWAPDNLVAACGRCNYGGGRRRAVDNSRRRMEYLERVIQEQDQRIQELVERLMEYENDRPQTRRAAIHRGRQSP